MPKLSIYVPDDLWEGAKAVRPDSASSQLVQEALSALVRAASGRPTFANERPKRWESAIRLEAGRLKTQARKLYESGYKYGIELANKLDWGSLDDLASCRWKLGPWQELLARRGEVEVAEKLNRLHGEFYDVEGGEATFHQGLVDALKDIWNAVRDQA